MCRTERLHVCLGFLWVGCLTERVVCYIHFRVLYLKKNGRITTRTDASVYTCSKKYINSAEELTCTLHVSVDVTIIYMYIHCIIPRISGNPEKVFFFIKPTAGFWLFPDLIVWGWTLTLKNVVSEKNLFSNTKSTKASPTSISLFPYTQRQGTAPLQCTSIW